ncbi:sodium-dependent transporter [Bacteroidota bacterium]
MKQQEFFTSRWGLILATLGIAIGTGNIWRFSRVVAQNGGGSFLIPWIIFLLIWSLPLIITEFALGKSARYGPIGSIAKTAGKKYGWMGAFVAFVSTAIMFYYSVVTGWCIKYFFSAISGDLFNVTSHFDYWQSFSSSYLPVLFHFIAILIGSVVIFKGIVKGIERVNKLLVTSLIIILLVLFFRAVSLPNAIEGIKYFFTPQKEFLFDYKVWLNALTQNAWDTGAGWGLILTYAIYMRKKEDVGLNATLIGFGNNSISLIAGITIFSTVFALGSVDAMSKISESGPANTGLTFIYLPMLFSNISGNEVINTFFASIFFLALSFAAMSSLISLIELATRTFIDMGFLRKNAIILVGTLGFIFGIPSAISIKIFTNQDWVWGVGLIISGAFIAFTIIKYGVDKFRTEVINGMGSDISIGKWYNFVIKYLIPLQVIVLLGWWLISSYSWDQEWWNPFHAENAATCIFQWLIILIVFIGFNKILVKKTLSS